MKLSTILELLLVVGVVAGGVALAKKRAQQKKAIEANEHKLDEALADSMPASDPVAAY
ncbi:MAG: hypothetical protein ACK4XJ_03435 [Fimbriimonadaceae bacterium]